MNIFANDANPISKELIFFATINSFLMSLPIRTNFYGIILRKDALFCWRKHKKACLRIIATDKSTSEKIWSCILYIEFNCSHFFISDSRFGLAGTWFIRLEEKEWNIRIKEFSLFSSLPVASSSWKIWPSIHNNLFQPKLKPAWGLPENWPARPTALIFYFPH